MPIRYERDDRNKRAVIAITGAFDSSEVLTCLEHHRIEGGWTYGLLYDLRYMSGQPTMETLREFVRTLERRPGEPPRGLVAFVSPDPVMYGRACTYGAMAGALARIEVFHDRDEAEAWLSENVGA